MDVMKMAMNEGVMKSNLVKSLLDEAEALLRIIVTFKKTAKMQVITPLNRKSEIGNRK